MADNKSQVNKNKQDAATPNRASSFVAVVFLIVGLLPIFAAGIKLVQNFISHIHKQTINRLEPILPPPTTVRIAFATAISIAISIRGLRKKSLDLSGSITAVVVGFCMTLSNTGFFIVLITFFFTSSSLTKFKSEIKRRIEDDFKEGGQRNWVQVLCNGGIPCVAAIIYVMTIGSGILPINFMRFKYYNPSLLAVSVVTSLACCAGDTWASEIGSAIGSRTPRLITTLQPVPVGTNGGISIIGTISSIAGGLVIGLSYYLSIYWCCDRTDNAWDKQPPQWPIIVCGALAGFLGSMIDSYLGASVQYSGYCKESKKVLHYRTENSLHISGYAILNNHAVNFVSSLITTIIMSYGAVTYWPA
ncbi:Transmembrane protein 19 [Trichoplax sp. H2]|nr:Transmembrane protein 19 [Trichoplax sp. H2]|eukprot:RDD40229.1 Transmembrane protein 19 [Trichoplax sp. H2]